MPPIGASQFGAFLVDGYSLLSAKVKEFSHEVEVELEPSEGLGDSWRATLPTGMRNATIIQNGAFFDTTAAGIHAAMSAAPATTRLVAWAPAGNSIGALFVACQGTLTAKYGVLSEGAKLTKANAAYQVTGALDEGVIVQAHGAVTADGDNASVDYTLDPTQTVIPITSNTLANPSVVTTPVPHGRTTGDIILISGVITSNPTINGSRTVTVISPTSFSVPVNVTTAGTGGSFVLANTRLGGVGYQFASAFSGLTGYIGKIRMSPDDTTYADAVTFVNVTAAPDAQRITVAGTIDRYLRYNKDVTGSGSVTPFAGFKRT
jgi:hypothetical protein